MIRDSTPTASRLFPFDPAARLPHAGGCRSWLRGIADRLFAREADGAWNARASRTSFDAPAHEAVLR